MACFSALVITLNFMQIFMICNIHKKKAYEKLLPSLSLSDVTTSICSSIVGTLLFVEKHYNLLVLPHQMWIAWSLLAMWGVLAAIMHVISISLDRLAAVVFPLRHKVYVTGRVIKTAIAIDLCASRDYNRKLSRTPKLNMRSNWRYFMYTKLFFHCFLHVSENERHTK